MTSRRGRRIAATTSCTAASDSGLRGMTPIALIRSFSPRAVRGWEREARMKRTHLAAAAVTLFLVVHGAHAALFDDEEARRRIESTNVRLTQLQRQIEDRVAALEQRMQGQGLADLANQLQLLQGDIAKLRGQIEVVTYELEQAQKRQRDLYVDLDTRLRKIESAAASPPPNANAAEPAAGANANPPPAPGGAVVAAPPAATAPPPGPIAALPPARNSADGVAE